MVRLGGHGLYVGGIEELSPGFDQSQNNVFDVTLSSVLLATDRFPALLDIILPNFSLIHSS